MQPGQLFRHVETHCQAENGSFKVIKGFSASAVTAELAFKMSPECALELSSSMPDNIVETTIAQNRPKFSETSILPNPKHITGISTAYKLWNQMSQNRFKKKVY